MKPARLRKQIEIKRIVAILEKRPLAPVPTLGHVVRDPKKYHAGKPCHPTHLSQTVDRGNLGVYVPVTLIA